MPTKTPPYRPETITERRSFISHGLGMNANRNNNGWMPLVCALAPTEVRDSLGQFRTRRMKAVNTARLLLSHYGGEFGNYYHCEG